MLSKLSMAFSLIPVAFMHVVTFFATIISGIKQKLIAIGKTLKGPSFLAWAKQYTPSQWCYFVSGFLLIISIFTPYEFFTFTALLAFVGLLRELTNIFHKIWDSNVGKGFIILIYASTANLALAFAALKINIITGIEPGPFIFTLGFTTLVLMPFWIALSSIVVFLFVLILANIWLFISVFLRVIGFKVKVHWEDKNRAFLTMILRIVLIPIVLVHLVTIMIPYASGDLARNIGVNGEGIWINFEPELEPKLELELNNLEQESDSTELQLEQTQTSLNSELTEQEIAQLPSSDEQELVDSIQQKQKLIESMIAHFIFYLESYSKSACVKAEDQHSVVIDENMILLIRKNEENPIGYDYEVKACQPRYQDTQQNVSN
jgi:hypothetical protein